MGNKESSDESTAEMDLVGDENLRHQIQMETGCVPGRTDENILKMLQMREYCPGKGGPWNNKKKVHALQRYLPTSVNVKLIKRYRYRVFCGKFSQDGDIFMSASQDRKIRFYDSNTWKKLKEVVGSDVGWSVIDTDFSPDQRWLVYSGWSKDIDLCDVVGEHEIHDALEVSQHDQGFCLFSIKFSPDSNELLGGSNDQCLYIYDLNRRERTLKLLAHQNDINTVCYAGPDSNTILSGSDDCLCKVWDRRTLGKGKTPMGVMVGHYEGITHIHSKGDGRYFISNGKDQCIKLWDIRKMDNTVDIKSVSRSSYDYRYGVKENSQRMKGDRSLMTYSGHAVSKTLIRCYFSPAGTGQKYILSGSSDGCIYVYDILTGHIVTKLKGHRGPVRDLSWHPNLPTIVSTSWDTTLARWEYGSAPSTFSLDEVKSEDGDFTHNYFYY